MLLTSSQVSIALSSGIVVFFTAALFLSGYAIQQRTLRDIRAAIKAPPQPEPKIFLPDRFKKSTTELPDGTIIEVDGDGRPITGGSRSNNQKPLRARPKKQRQRQRQRQSQEGKDEIIIEIKPTLPDEKNGRGGSAAKKDDQKPVTNKTDGKNVKKESNTKPTNSKTKQQKAKDGKDQKGGKKEAKEKVLLPGPDAVPHPDDEEKLVSRAERRRLIKEELQRLSQGKEKVYWQRRLW